MGHCCRGQAEPGSFHPLYFGAELFLWEKTRKNSLNKSWGTLRKRLHKQLSKIKQEENSAVLIRDEQGPAAVTRDNHHHLHLQSA